MNTTEFRKELKKWGLDTRKQRGLEVLDIIHDGTEQFSVTYAELHPVTDVAAFLAKKFRPDYIPPLG